MYPSKLNLCSAYAAGTADNGVSLKIRVAAHSVGSMAHQPSTFLEQRVQRHFSGQLIVAGSDSCWGAPLRRSMSRVEQ